MPPPESILRWRVIASVTGLAAVAAYALLVSEQARRCRREHVRPPRRLPERWPVPRTCLAAGDDRRITGCDRVAAGALVVAILLVQIALDDAERKAPRPGRVNRARL